MKIVVVYGSVREGRQGIKCARFVRRMLEARGHEAVLVDPAEHELPLLDKMFKQYEAGQAPAPLERLASLYRSADGFVFVSGEYNHGLPPALKNLIDHFQSEYFWRPAGIVTYSAGPFGGVRAAVHLRAVLGEVGLVTLPTMFPVSRVGQAFDDEGREEAGEYERRMGKFLDELDWYAAALRKARADGVPYS